MIQNNNIKIRLINDKDKYTPIERMGKTVIKSIDNTIKKENYFEPAINFSNLSVDTADTHENISNHCLDSIRSGESLIKCYIFDHGSTGNKDADKIAAFWKAIEEHKDIQPVKPTFNMGKGHKPVKKLSDRSDSVHSNPDEEYVWYNKLLEMKKHNMDKAALAASGRCCKMCDLTPQCAPKSQTRGAKDVDAKELIKLNDWKPQSIKKSTDESSAQETSTIMKRSNNKNPEEECTKPELLNKHGECSSNQEIKNPMKIKRRNIEEKTKATNQKTQKQPPKKEGRSPNKDLAQPPTLLHSKVADVCSSKSLRQQVDENRLEEHEISFSENQCSICLQEQCVCKQNLDEQAKEFMEELRSQMANLHKNRSDSVTNKLDDVEKNDPICCEICDDPHVCTLMNKDLLAGEIHLPTTIEDDYLQTIFKVRPKVHSSDLILVETEKEARSDSAQKMKKVTYVRRGDSTLLDLGESIIVTPKMSRSVSIIGIQKHVESDDSLIVYVEPLSWYSSEIQK